MDCTLQEKDTKPSTHQCLVVSVNPEPHPNADQLSLVKVYGYQAVIRTEDWKDTKLAVYIPPDSLVNVRRKEFAFLADKPVFNSEGKITGYKRDESMETTRVKAKRLRGQWSMGLLVPAPEGAREGDDLAEALGVEHWNPPEPGEENPLRGTKSPSAPGPSGLTFHKYDLESLRRFSQAFADGETVIVTEKIHGANAKYIFWDGKFYAGTRTRWTVESDRCPWWQGLNNTPRLREFLEKYPGIAVFGELYGAVQKFKYGIEAGKRLVMVFDLYDAQAGKFYSWSVAKLHIEHYGIPTVPALYEGPYSFATCEGLAEGPSTVTGADHVREGCVVRGETETWDEKIGRRVLKLVGNGYLEKS